MKSIKEIEKYIAEQEDLLIRITSVVPESKIDECYFCKQVTAEVKALTWALDLIKGEINAKD